MSIGKHYAENTGKNSITVLWRTHFIIWYFSQKILLSLMVAIIASFQTFMSYTNNLNSLIYHPLKMTFKTFSWSMTNIFHSGPFYFIVCPYGVSAEWKWFGASNVSLTELRAHSAQVPCKYYHLARSVSEPYHMVHMAFVPNLHVRFSIIAQ